MGKSVLVSGANGYLGSAICQYFLSKQWKVFTATRDNDNDIYLDLNFPEEFAQKTINEPVDLFIHTAASHEVFCQKNPYKCIFYNVAGTKAALEFCVLNQIPKFIYISTFHVFGNPQGIINENTIPQPSNDYGLSHFQAEEYVQMYNKNAKLVGTVVRPSNFFGVPEDINTFKRWTLTPFAFCREAIETQKIVLKTSGQQKRNFISVRDICRYLELIYPNMEQLSLAHLTGINTITILNLAKTVQKVVKNEFKIDVELIVPEDVNQYVDFEYVSLYQDKIFEPSENVENFVVDFCRLLIQNKKLNN
jgi:UDP-glucose 4-epimerase